MIIILFSLLLFSYYPFVSLRIQDPSMEILRSKFHVYISLASPHIGTAYADSQLVATGMWALTKWSKCRSLKELSLDDTFFGGAESTLLFKLSTNGVLDHFKRVVLFSSPKDQYVPGHSARIQVPHKAETDYLRGTAIKKMTGNLLSKMNPESLVRVTLLNNVPDTASAVDSFIGRAAHICYLDNAIVVQQLVYSLYPYFS